MPPRKIECEVLKVLINQESGKSKNQLRIVRWSVDGKDTGPLLEKRNFYQTQEGEEKLGKARGLTLDDVKHVVQNWKDIESILSAKK